MRALLIGVGAALIHMFHWVLYVFGAFLVFTAIKLAFQKEEGVHPEKNPIIKLVKKIIPVTHEYHGGKFFVCENMRWMATPLFIVLMVVETTDVIFALDSIPAIFAITTDPFIVYTSNIFAILGLRALYFALAGLMGYFHYLKIGLSAVLFFVGMKMLLEDIFPIPIGISLGVIAGILGLSIAASLRWPKKEES
jgi:tellurite resistance protein TerC